MSGLTWIQQAHGPAPYRLVRSTQTLNAAGYAMSIQREAAEIAVVAYFGDEAASQGAAGEAFMWAGVHNLPLVFFCQNSTTRQARRKTSPVPLTSRPPR